MKILHITQENNGFTFYTTHKAFSIHYDFTPQMGTELDREPVEIHDLVGWTICAIAFEDQIIQIHIERASERQRLFFEKRGAHFNMC